MKSLMIITLALLSANLFAAESSIKDSRLLGDCKELSVLKKVLNGVPSIAITEGPSVAFSAKAPTPLQTVAKKCIVDINLAVPAGHKVGVYDPKTNHLHLGRFNGAQYLYDNESSFKYEVSWDLADAASIPFQSRSVSKQGPYFSSHFGGDFQAVLPHQWSACKRTPHMVNLKVGIVLQATSSRVNTAELVFRNMHLRLTTQKCGATPLPPRRRPVPRRLGRN